MDFEPRRISAALLASCLIHSGPAALAAPPPAITPPIVVNQTLAGAQQRSAVGIDDSGRFTVAWVGPESGSGNAFGIFLRKFDAAGSPTAGELPGNVFHPGTQSRPSVAVNAAGDFLSLWTSTDQLGPATGDDLIGRRAVGGGALGAEIAVENGAYTDTEGSDVAVADDGSFVFVWEDDIGNDLRARRFGANGVAITGDIAVNQSLAVLVEPHLAAGVDGTFFIAWSGSQGQVIGRCFDGDGFALGSEFFLRGDSLAGTQGALVAADEDGRFLAVWMEIRADVPDALFARRFDRDCTPLSPARLVAEDVLFENLQLDVGPEGSYAVVWERTSSEGDGDVFALEVTKDGVAVDVPIQVHPVNILNQIPRGVAVAPGTFAVVWDELEGNEVDFDVVARLFERRIVFTDGFEDGDADGWSAVVP